MVERLNGNWDDGGLTVPVLSPVHQVLTYTVAYLKFPSCLIQSYLPLSIPEHFRSPPTLTHSTRVAVAPICEHDAFPLHAACCLRGWNDSPIAHTASRHWSSGNRSITDMRHLTSEIRSEKCVVRRFRRCANVIQCTLCLLDRASLW